MSRFYATAAMMLLAVVAVVVRGAFNEPDWGFQFHLDGPAPLDCNHSTLVVEGYNFVEWELPSGKMLTGGTQKFALSNLENVVNGTLTVQDLKEEDHGVYVCHVYTNMSKFTKRGQLLRGLNLGGPKYREPFDEYRENLMVGGLAALVLFVPLVSACFIYKFRYQTKEQKRDKHAARLENTRHQRHLQTSGKGAELSDVAVNGGKGEINDGYHYADEVGTRL